ncbi:hypothetical protein AJ79_08682 [Helicocarpus griseus UAMH5409]|uniref:3'-5' exonuclease domain-containing protein n=1 Tax=Helicocarpus griseus UAMH5409 TaxID=1447875 RepID=A0A2B7WRA8_9EURO|nr:hypothetical protein AJ79_08682 [Helicocarpus griseus UAMH5409]
MASWICTVFEWLRRPNRSDKHRHNHYQAARNARYKTVLPMSSPTLPSKIMLSGPCIAEVERFDGIVHRTRTENLPSVQASARQRLDPLGTLVVCDLETFEQAPNSLNAAHEMGENWVRVKEKKGKRLWQPMTVLSGDALPNPTVHRLPETSLEPFTPVWITWDGPQTLGHRMRGLCKENPFLSDQLDTLSLSDDYQYRSLDIALSCIGLSAAYIPHVLPLKYGTYELMVQTSKLDQLRKVFQTNAYDPFDKESRLVRVHGLKATIDIVVGRCHDMRSQDTWPGAEKWLHDRIIELKDLRDTMY